MNAETTCMRCGGANLESGALRSTGAMHFRPQGAKFLKLKTADVDVDARLCLDCGTIALGCDAQKVKSLIGKE